MLSLVPGEAHSMLTKSLETKVNDLNYLFRRQQQERSLASNAASSAARTAHERLSAMYEDEIRRLTDERIRIAPPLPRA